MALVSRTTRSGDRSAVIALVSWLCVRYGPRLGEQSVQHTVLRPSGRVSHAPNTLAELRVVASVWMADRISPILGGVPLPQNSGRTATERGPGRPFAKGQSGNPGGRPKGLVRAIREQTQDGEELVSFMLRGLRGEAEGGRLRDRLEAASWLADRGFGKPTQAMEVSGKD